MLTFIFILLIPVLLFLMIGLVYAVVAGVAKGMYDSSKDHSIKWKGDWRETFVKGWSKDPRQF